MSALPIGWTAAANGALLLVLVALLVILILVVVRRRQTEAPMDLHLPRTLHAYRIALAGDNAGMILDSWPDASESGVEIGQATGTHIHDWHPENTEVGQWFARMVESRTAPAPIYNPWTDVRGRDRTAKLSAVVLANGTALIVASDVTELAQQVQRAEARADAAESRAAAAERRFDRVEERVSEMFDNVDFSQTQAT